jgi:hypothetical protein
MFLKHAKYCLLYQPFSFMSNKLRKGTRIIAEIRPIGKAAHFEPAYKYYQKHRCNGIFLRAADCRQGPDLLAATGKVKNMRYMHRMLDVVGARDILRTL